MRSDIDQNDRYAWHLFVGAGGECTLCGIAAKKLTQFTRQHRAALRRHRL